MKELTRQEKLYLINQLVRHKRECAYQATERLRERNIRQEDDIQLLTAYFENSEDSTEFHKQQAEFWAAECISEQRKAHVSHVVMIIACVLSGAAIGMNMLMCQ